MCALKEKRSYSHTPKHPDLDLKNQPSLIAKTCIEELPMLESKDLPDYLRYVFLGSGNTLSMSVVDDLSEQHVEALISALKRYIRAMGWTIDDVIGISPGIGMHKGHLEEYCMPTSITTTRLLECPNGQCLMNSSAETTTTQYALVYDDGFSSENKENVKKDTAVTEIKGATPSDEKTVGLGPLVYKSKAEAKSVFKILSESANIGSDCTWDQAMREVINNWRYGALKSLCERKQAFNEASLQVGNVMG
ncbi:hypothetical protein CQW23_30846 [Capsicum baccatum]|uniref:FF domain-containing protein n=1 Tax=Capsicum baccatum TaxID=33114 RepID=A0A2G2V986_CAPBA|nr:hypothetical protein CQW23_30846 [Capsicum baccatum]